MAIRTRKWISLWDSFLNNKRCTILTRPKYLPLSYPFKIPLNPKPPISKAKTPLNPKPPISKAKTPLNPKPPISKTKTPSSLMKFL
ncbi:hypothetical protein HanPSC8_Chr17g0750091 [Helianthus annuus]|nr:hypothetical protein HanPSC8_Chr17g0750091 [Helianthus annuus]